MLTSPVTSSCAVGVIFPIPTNPLELTYIDGQISLLPFSILPESCIEPTNRGALL